MDKREGFIDKWISDLAQAGHFIEKSTARIIDRSWQVRFPLILEGSPGAGKTSLAKKIAQVRGAEFYRLQCEKNIGKKEALYHWNEKLQDIAVELEARNRRLLPGEVKNLIYDPAMLVRGTLMEALQDSSSDVVILIDELDKASDDFEALLLEFLGEFTITINEINQTIHLENKLRPLVIITSNAGINGHKLSLSRPIRRRSLYCWLEEPSIGSQFMILKQAAPNLSDELIKSCTRFIKKVLDRRILEEPFTLSETKMWVECLDLMGVTELNEEVIKDTVDLLVKSSKDTARLLEFTPSILKSVFTKAT